MTHPQRHPRLVGATVLLLGALLLACASGAVSTVVQTTNDTPSWACPSPMPLPYGDQGPVKDTIRTLLPTTSPTGPDVYDEQPVYYQAWEQEYGKQVSSPPYPTPTPYAIVGTSYVFGQRVHVAPVYVTIAARSTVALGNGKQLYLVDLTWNNPTAAIIAVDYGQQVAITAITDANGRVQSGDGWHVSKDALAAASMVLPDANIATGESTVTLPIIGPAGNPQMVSVTFLRAGASSALGTAIAASQATPQPTANTNLQAAADARLVVQWSNAQTTVGPPCGDPGAMTEWESGSGVAWGKEAVPVAAPPGSSRVIQLALNQVGKQYVWGATGPETFDCSGLMQWVYGQIGIRIPRTAENQRAGLKPVALPNIQPGDTVYFAPPGARAATHVAMYIGDQNGDGTSDIVHAFNPKLGVRVTNNIFGSAYFNGPKCELCIIGFRTAR